MVEPVPVSMRRGWLPALGLPWLAVVAVDHEMLVMAWHRARRRLAEVCEAFVADDARYRAALHEAAQVGGDLDAVPAPSPAAHREARLAVLREREQAARAALGAFVERVLTVDLRARLDELSEVAAQVYDRSEERRRVGNLAAALHSVVAFPLNEVAAVRQVVTGEQVLPATLALPVGPARVGAA